MVPPGSHVAGPLFIHTQEVSAIKTTTCGFVLKDTIPSEPLSGYTHDIIKEKTHPLGPSVDPSATVLIVSCSNEALQLLVSTEN